MWMKKVSKNTQGGIPQRCQSKAKCFIYDRCQLAGTIKSNTHALQLQILKNVREQKNTAFRYR